LNAMDVYIGETVDEPETFVQEPQLGQPGRAAVVYDETFTDKEEAEPESYDSAMLRTRDAPGGGFKS